MKKLLSLLLTLCLLIAVTVIPIPAMAATGEIIFDFGEYGTTGSPVSHTIGEAINYPELPTHPDGSLVWSLYNDVYEEPPAVLEDDSLQVYVVLLEGVFDFEDYDEKIDKYLKYSGRVIAIDDPADATNTVIKFDNNGIPYRSSEMDKSNSYTKSGSKYTKVDAADIDTSNYTNYYHTSAQATDFSSKTKNTVTYNAETGVKTAISFNKYEAYNAIQLGELEASTTYKITVNYKRINLDDELYIQPVTWAQSTNWRTTMYVDDNYERITIPTGSNDSAWQTVATYVTTPADLVNATANSYEQNGNVLRLVLFTGEQDANNVVYFDNITVEEVVAAKLTYHNADGTTKEVNLESGSKIDYPDLAPSKLGENGGIWYADAQGTKPAPAVMPAANLDVYEVVKTGVFDFNNYYRYDDYTGNSYGINSAYVKDSIYADGNGNIIVDTTKYAAATNGSTAALRNFLIAIGEAKAATKYKITVEYSYTAGNKDQRLILTPLTCYGTLTTSGITGGKDARNIGTSVELPQGNNQSVDLFFTSVDEFFVNKDTSGKALMDEVANSFYLIVTTKEDGQTAGDNSILATISKVTVVEYVEPAQTCTVTLNRGGVTEEVEVEKGKEFTLPDTEFTETAWWNNATASSKARFVGYEGEKVVVNGDVTYYTAETYSDGKTSIYRNWTGLDTTTEDFSYFYKTVTSDAESEWSYSGTSRVCTRLGVVEDGKTYRISVTYKATTDADITFQMSTTSLTNSGATTRNYLEGGKAFHTVSENTDGWETATFYITADLPAKVTESDNGLDDTKAFTGEGLYLNLGKAAGNHNVDIAIKETKVEDLGNVVEAKGASVLTDAAAEEAGAQAMRYYFDYKTATDGTTITVGGKEYTVKERGFLYINGDVSHYAKENVEEGYNGYYIYSSGNTTYGFATSHFMMWLADAKDAAHKGNLSYSGVSGDALLKKWNLESNTLTFSTYIKNISELAYDAKFMVRGYVTFEDENGVEHTVYSKTTNRSVNGIANVLNERH